MLPMFNVPGFQTRIAQAEQDRAKAAGRKIEKLDLRPRAGAQRMAEPKDFNIQMLEEAVRIMQMAPMHHHMFDMCMIHAAASIPMRPERSVTIPREPVKPRFDKDPRFLDIVEHVAREGGYLRNAPFPVDRIGEGYYASVYVCPYDTTKVVKIGRQVSSDGWLDYAGFCLDQREARPNPLLPVIHQLEIKRKFYVALLDRYDMTAHEAMKQRLPKTFAMKYEAIREVFSVGKQERWRRIQPAKEYTGYAVEPCQETLVHAYRLDAQLQNYGLKPNDLHANNFMFRKEGSQLYITDPASDPSSHGTLDRLHKLGVPIEQ
jgi:hypothetical protein